MLKERIKYIYIFEWFLFHLLQEYNGVCHTYEEPNNLYTRSQTPSSLFSFGNDSRCSTPFSSPGYSGRGLWGFEIPVLPAALERIVKIKKGNNKLGNGLHSVWFFTLNIYLYNMCVLVAMLHANFHIEWEITRILLFFLFFFHENFSNLCLFVLSCIYLFACINYIWN